MLDGSERLQALLLAGARDRRSFSLAVTTDEGMGRIYVNVGEVVHATYGHLNGEEAVHAMLAAPGVEVEPALQDHRQAAVPTRALALASAPLPRLEASFRTPAASVARARSAPPPLALVSSEVSARALPKNAAARPRKRMAPVVAGALAAGALAGAGYTWVSRVERTEATPRVPAPLAGTTSAAPGAFPEAAGGSAPSDAPGRPSSTQHASSAPAVAQPELAPVASVPAVVFKLLVGADGRPASVRIAESRLDSSLFERIALAEAQKLEFRPALLGGVPVAAEMDWTVSFRAEATPEPPADREARATVNAPR